MRRLTDELRSKGAESVVITSVVESETNQHMVCGYDKAENKYFEIPYDYISVRFPGTGDIFSAILTGSILNGMGQEEGTAVFGCPDVDTINMFKIEKVDE